MEYAIRYILTNVIFWRGSINTCVIKFTRWSLFFDRAAFLTHQMAFRLDDICQKVIFV